MFTKLILLLIFINIVGSILKKIKKREQEKRIREGWEQETPAGAESRRAPELEEEQPFETEGAAEPDPDDVLQQLFAKLEGHTPAPARSAEPVAEAQEPYSPPPVSATAQPSHVSTEPERPMFRNEHVPREYEARGYEAREHEKREYDKIRESKSLIDLTPEYQSRSLIPEDEGRILEPSLSLVTSPPVPDSMENASERIRSRGGLRQAVVMAEILGKPRAIQPGAF